MTILVALVPGRNDNGALALGAVLAASLVEDVVVASVVLAPWPPDPYRADEEYLQLQERQADQTLRRAREQLGGAPLTVETVVQRGSSVSAGLLEVMSGRGISMVVVGSSSSGLVGRVMLGGVVERLLHSSEVPVAVAPRGYQAARGARAGRLSVGLGRADSNSQLLTRAAAAAQGLSAELRVVCFAVRPMASLTAGVEEDTERLVVNEFVDRLKQNVASALGASPAASDGALATKVEVVVGEGSSWADAVQDVSWSPADVLVIGTSSSPLSRFFLGSHASKIVRSSPVPVVLLARA